MFIINSSPNLGNYFDSGFKSIADVDKKVYCYNYKSANCIECKNIHGIKCNCTDCGDLPAECIYKVLNAGFLSDRIDIYNELGVIKYETL